MPIERIDSLNRYTQLQQGNQIKNTVVQSPLVQNRQTTNSIIEDSVEFLNAQKEQKLSDKQEKVKKIREEFEDIKKYQALIGKSWDKIKNIIGKKTGSAYVEKQIKAYEKGEISDKEIKNILNEYKTGQEESVETVADIISGISALGFYTLAITTAPLYGLGIIALGVITASIAGATVKTVTKYADALARDKKYNSYIYDIYSFKYSN